MTEFILIELIHIPDCDACSNIFNFFFTIVTIVSMAGISLGIFIEFVRRGISGSIRKYDE
ncbi:MAG: hypothetical protein GY749_48295 [Desulfobacteraceae bacterium]|nr:hypothetical protein [Desulfobacteraceae bacterium]